MNLRIGIVRKIWSSFLFCLIFSVLITTISSAAILTVDNTTGQLLGASGVSVNGKLYDVEFIDASPRSIWGPNYDNFTFTTEAEAILASHALLNQVFIDGIKGNFDTTPWLTNGIEGANGYVATGFSLDLPFVWAITAQNMATEVDDRIYLSNCFIDYDLISYPENTWAIWSEASAVPIPNTLLLLSVGCLSLAGFRRRGKE